jgi:hypothetical protein
MFDTLRPVFPKKLYSIFVSAAIFLSSSSEGKKKEIRMSTWEQNNERKLIIIVSEIT